jgi:hypothetical protein
LRRTETSKLDVVDWGRNPAAPEFGRFGMLHVRYGEAVRGQSPRRRNVPSVMGWAVEAVAVHLGAIVVGQLLDVAGGMVQPSVDAAPLAGIFVGEHAADRHML